MTGLALLSAGLVIGFAAGWAAAQKRIAKREARRRELSFAMRGAVDAYPLVEEYDFACEAFPRGLEGR